MNKKIILISILCIFTCLSLALNGFLVFSAMKNSNECQSKEVNLKVLTFRNMFTEEVLLANKEIDFDTRLSLETAVRSLNDAEILAQWQKFTNSQTKEQATAEAKNLLSLLIQKTSQ